MRVTISEFRRRVGILRKKLELSRLRSIEALIAVKSVIRVTIPLTNEYMNRIRIQSIENNISR